MSMSSCMSSPRLWKVWDSDDERGMDIGDADRLDDLDGLGTSRRERSVSEGGAGARVCEDDGAGSGAGRLVGTLALEGFLLLTGGGSGGPRDSSSTGMTSSSSEKSPGQLLPDSQEGRRKRVLTRYIRLLRRLRRCLSFDFAVRLDNILRLRL